MSYVLIAEPDASRALVYKNLVSDAGLQTFLVRDGEHAQFLIRTKGLPSLLITELALPKVDGFALLRKLREQADPTHVPAIVVSGIRDLRDEAVRLKAELGITSLLATSSPVSTVERAIKNALVPPVSRARSPLADPPLPQPLPGAEAERERRRLARIAAMNLVDDLPPDEGLQRLVAEVAEVFGVPIALVSLVLEHRQWFKAHFGLSGQLLEERGTPRDWSFCRHVVENEQPLVVPDAATNPYFASNPLVQQGAVRGYAGVPLKTPGGEVLGTLCIVDTKPLTVGAEDLELLAVLARRVAGELELRSEAQIASRELARQGRELALLAAVTGHLDHGVMLLDDKRRVVFANDALERLTGLQTGGLAGRPRAEWLEMLAAHLADPGEAARKLGAPEEGPFAGQEDLELVLPRRRVLRWTTKPIPLGSGAGQLCIYSDVTAERDLERQREALALTDFLTRLPNRRSGEETLLREAARADRLETPLGLVLFDVDRLARTNELRGHDTGDVALRAVAAALQRSVRATDVVCRWGADEFLAILPAVDEAGAKVVAERARRAVAGLELPEGHRVSVSAGTAQLELNEPVGAALGRAEAGLARAKEGGRNQVC